MDRKRIGEIIEESRRVYEEDMDQDNRDIRDMELEIYRLRIIEGMYEHQLKEALSPFSTNWREAWESLVDTRKNREALELYLEYFRAEALIPAGPEEDFPKEVIA